MQLPGSKLRISVSNEKQKPGQTISGRHPANKATSNLQKATMLEEIYQAWWRPYSALQFAVRRLSRAAENSLEKMAAIKLVKSYTDIKSYLYKSYF